MTPTQAEKISKQPTRAKAYLLASEAHNEALQGQLNAARHWAELLAVAYVDLLRRDLVDPNTAEVKMILELIRDETGLQ